MLNRYIQHSIIVYKEFISEQVVELYYICIKIESAKLKYKSYHFEILYNYIYMPS